MRWKPIINGLLIEALALLIFLALCQGAWAATYYVDTGSAFGNFNWGWQW